MNLLRSTILSIVASLVLMAVPAAARAQVTSGEQKPHRRHKTDAASLQKKATEAQARIHANKDDRDELMGAVKTNEVPLAKQVLLRNGFTAQDLENAKITLRTGGGKGGEDEIEISATCCDPKEITIQRSLEYSQNSCCRNRANQRSSIAIGALPIILIRIFRWNRFLIATLNFLNQEIRNPFFRKRNASCVPNLIFFERNVSRDESDDGIGQVRFSGPAERRCASS